MTNSPNEEVPSRLSCFQHNVATLNPAYFALTMATGIVSIACHFMQMRLAIGLLYVNVVAFVILWMLTAARIWMFPDRVLADLTDHKRSVGFFTSVAACCVLGNQFLLIAGLRSAALVLWIVGIVLWFVLTYVVFTSVTVKESKPPLADGIHGGWLVAVVATQAVSALGGLLADGFSTDREQVLFFSLSMWLGGGMLYIWIISLIFYRYSFFPMSPADLSPPYWINMGAMAISTLAGTILISAAKSSPILSQLLPFLKGFTLFFWATATWWIPMLVILGVWRHLYKRFRLAYDPLYWGAVFPLGMYTACTYRLALALDLPFLLFIPRCFAYIALAAWVATFAGMLASIASDLRREPTQADRIAGNS